MPECTNLAENYDIITLVTIRMLLVTITTISQHIEDPGIVKSVYSGIFRHIQEYAVMFIYNTRHLQESVKHVR